MEDWKKREIIKLIEEELEVEVNKRIYLAARYIVQELGQEGKDIIEALTTEDKYFVEELVELEEEKLSIKGREVYEIVINYMSGRDNSLEEEIGQEAILRASQVSERLFREELEDRYRMT